MRLIQLLADGSEGSELDLHPMISVIPGLTEAAHDRIVRAVGALPMAADPGGGGLLEAHGVLLDLSPEMLALLDMSQDIDVVVTRAEVSQATGLGVAPEPDAEVKQAAVKREEARRFLEQAPPGRYPELDQARERQVGAREALDILLEVTARSRRDSEAAASKLAAARKALDVATGASDGSDTMIPPLGLVGSTDGGDDSLDARRLEIESAIEEQSEQVARAERGLDELSTIDSRPIQVLLDAIRNPAPIELVPSERANELADEFVALQAEVAQLEDRLEAEGVGPVSAMRQLDQARAELADAERAMAKPMLMPEDVEALEQAHDELLELEHKSSGIRRRGGQKRLEEAHARQQEILDRVGFPTWSAYVMGANLMSIDPLAEQRCARARSELEAAEANWARVTALIEADPEHSALLDQLESVYLEAFDLLGGDDGREDLETALRELQVPKREVTTDELVDALAYQLELVGLDLGDLAVSVDYATMVAEAFLAEAAEIDEREAELRFEIDEANAMIAVLRAERDSLESGSVEDDEAGNGDLIDLTGSDHDGDDAADDGSDGIAALEEALAIAEEDMAAAVEMLEAREALVDAATQVEAVAQSKLISVAGDLAAKEGGLPEVIRRGDGSGFEVAEQEEDGTDDVDYYLLSRLAAQRNVSYAGSVPLLLDNALADVPAEAIPDIMGELDKMSEAVQIVIISDDPAVVDWVEAAGFERAAVVSAPAAFG